MIPIPKFRAAILTVLFVTCAVFVNVMDTDSSTQISKPLDQIPNRIGAWQASESQAMGADVVDLLQVDDYILRNYRGDNGQSINVYVSYFSHTNQVKGYHSPLNCMPGSGWNIAETEPLSLSIPDSKQEPTVNRLLLQKGSARQVSLYWYQCRGRILNNEYEERIYRVIDSIFKNRTDGAFIRLIAGGEGNVQQNTEQLKDFAGLLIPTLRGYLPE